METDVLTLRAVLLVYGPLGVLALIGLVATVYLYKRVERREAEFTTEREAHAAECAGERERHQAAMAELVREHKEELGGMVERVVEALKQTREDARADNRRVLDLAEALERRTTVASPGRRG